MLTLEWRADFAQCAHPALLHPRCPALGVVLRDIAREAMDLNAQMNAHMNETLNIGGALLVKLFGRSQRRRNASVNGRQRARYWHSPRSHWLVVLRHLRPGQRSGHGAGLWSRRLLRHQDSFTVGTIVAFGSYLGSLYGALQGLAGAPVEFSTSMVSFERVFEIIDLPQDIVLKKKMPSSCKDVKGELEFDNVTFNYKVDEFDPAQRSQTLWQHG
jgi:ATP-binding cassette subfamily B protein